jgi:ComF family protein
MPLAQHLAPCPYCEGKGLRPFDRIARLGIYTSPLQDLVLRVKYSMDWPLAEKLAARLWQQDPVQAILKNADAIVPVPLHWRRHAMRGFNQAEVVARYLGRKSGKPVKLAIARLRDTPTQTAMHKRAARLENLKNAFGGVDPGAIRGKQIVLIDDVMTTGATLQTMAREVNRHKPAGISVIVSAIADPKGRAFELI